MVQHWPCGTAEGAWALGSDRPGFNPGFTTDSPLVKTSGVLPLS